MGMYQRPLRQDELMHYGVLGMKWGVRRYQPYAVVPRGKEGVPGIEIGEAKKLTKRMDKLHKKGNVQMVRAIDAKSNVDWRQAQVNRRQQKLDKKDSNWNRNRLTKANNKLTKAKLDLDTQVKKGKTINDEYASIGKKLVENNYNVYVKKVDQELWLSGRRSAEIALQMIGSGVLERGSHVTRYTGDINGYTLTQKRRKHKIRSADTDPNRNSFVIK